MNGVATVNMNRKITRIGNSLGLLATEAFRTVGLDCGDEVDIQVRKEVGEIVIRKAQPKISIPEGLDPRFFETLERNIKRYRATLEGLKNR